MRKRRKPNFNGVCKRCSREFEKYVRPSYFTTGRVPQYCSIKCFNAGKHGPVTAVMVECAWCSNKLERVPSKIKQSRSGLFFCNRLCKERAQADINNSKFDAIRPQHYGKGDGKNDYRKRAFAVYPPNCHVCGYDKLAVLVIHHIDCDRENNNIENLIPVCRNCHKEIHLGLTELTV